MIKIKYRKKSQCFIQIILTYFLMIYLILRVLSSAVKYEASDSYLDFHETLIGRKSYKEFNKEVEVRA
jgi:hypothetical protein